MRSKDVIIIKKLEALEQIAQRSIASGTVNAKFVNVSGTINAALQNLSGTINAKFVSVGGGGVSDGDKGDVTVSNTGATWTIDNDVVSNAKLRNSAALSVIGRASDAAGDPADIEAASDNTVLRRSGTSIGFGAIPQSAVTNLTSDLAGKQATDPALTGLAAVNSAGLLYHELNDTYSLYGVGVANASDIPTRGDADGRYSQSSDLTALSGTIDAEFINLSGTINAAFSALGGGWFGSGIDGYKAYTVDTTLDRNYAYNIIDLSNNAIVTTARFVLMCANTLTIYAGSAIRSNGVDGSGQTSGGTGGGVGAAGMMGVGSAGGNGGNAGAGGTGGTSLNQQPAGTAGTTCKGGDGGAGSQFAGAGGSLSVVTAAPGNPYYAGPHLGFFPYNSAGTPTAVNGGSGGGGGGGAAGATGGKGGGGGGVVVIIAKHIVNNGAIEAKGGAGAQGGTNAGGGGGGGGGKVFIMCRTYTGTAPDVSGGTKGAANGTGAAGNDGGTGVSCILYI